MNRQSTAKTSSKTSSSESMQFRVFMVVAMVIIYAGLPYLLFPGFVLDDSYVTYRYALNLLADSTLAWNVGEDPVEGFTSFLWVLVSVPPIALNIDPALWAKTVSIILMGTVMWSLSGLCLKLPMVDRIVICGSLLLSAPMVLHANQGMETAVTAVAIFWAVVVSYSVAEGARGWPSFLLLAVIMLLATLLRPEMAVFSAVLTCALGVLLLSKDRRAVLSMAIGFAPVVVVGIIYFIWRYNYFGYLLPNPAYIKSGDLSSSGIWMVFSFLLKMVAPVLLYTLFRIWSSLRSIEWSPLLPPLFAITALLFYQFTIVPIQGFEYRYQAPLFPAILFVLVKLLVAARDQLNRFPNKIVTGVVVAIMIIWVLPRFLAVRAEAAVRMPQDRIAAGLALNGIEGAALFTSEAGALPYYSGWRAYDHLGLTSEAIVHEGLTCELFETWEVDLVMLLNNRQNLYSGVFSVPLDCEAMKDFVPVAATKKNWKSSHVFFVDRNSPHAAEISRRLRTIEGVEYVTVGSLRTRRNEYSILWNSHDHRER